MAKITIQKKDRKNPFEELSGLINIPNLESIYPPQNLEPWRRFDPQILLPEFTESMRHGIDMSVVRIDNGVNDHEAAAEFQSALACASEWKKRDEFFLQKARNNLNLFKKTEATEFFENFISKTVNDDHFHILRLSKNKVYEHIPTIEIFPPDFDNKSAPQSKKACFNIFYIYCEESSKATINLVKNPGAFDLSIIYVFQEKNSEVRLRYLDENKKTSYGVGFIKFFQNEDSKSKSGFYSLSASQNKKVFVENNLLQKATTEQMGIFLGRYSHVDHDFFIEHTGSYSKSDLLFKMSVMDDSYGVFWGNADIVSGTKGCEAYQQNKNLILGNNSRIDAIPRLGIHTENVIAAHGSATGEISEDEIFYMMSRGLSYTEARKLLLRGFFEDVLRRSFEHDPDQPDVFLDRIWTNIQDILGVEISS